VPHVVDGALSLLAVHSTKQVARVPVTLHGVETDPTNAVLAASCLLQVLCPMIACSGHLPAPISGQLPQLEGSCEIALVVRPVKEAHAAGCFLQVLRPGLLGKLLMAVEAVGWASMACCWLGGNQA